MRLRLAHTSSGIRISSPVARRSLGGNPDHSHHRILAQERPVSYQANTGASSQRELRRPSQGCRAAATERDGAIRVGSCPAPKGPRSGAGRPSSRASSPPNLRYAVDPSAAAGRRHRRAPDRTTREGRDATSLRPAPPHRQRKPLPAPRRHGTSTASPPHRPHQGPAQAPAGRAGRGEAPAPPPPASCRTAGGRGAGCKWQQRVGLVEYCSNI